MANSPTSYIVSRCATCGLLLNVSSLTWTRADTGQSRSACAEILISLWQCQPFSLKSPRARFYALLGGCWLLVSIHMCLGPWLCPVQQNPRHESSVLLVLTCFATRLRLGANGVPSSLSRYQFQLQCLFLDGCRWNLIPCPVVSPMRLQPRRSAARGCPALQMMTTAVRQPFPSPSPQPSCGFPRSPSQA